MSNVIRFPETARNDVRHLPTDVLVRLFHEWDGVEADSKGANSVKGYSISAIQEEVNRRGDGWRVAV